MDCGDAIRRADAGPAREPASRGGSGAVAFQDLRAAAQRLGFTLVTPAWHGATARYRFRCAQGHELTRGVGPVRQGTLTCPGCAWLARKAQLLEQLHRRGITCDEAALHSLTQRHRFVCARGHAWPARQAMRLSVVRALQYE